MNETDAKRISRLNDALRILHLSRQWQDPRCWHSSYHHAEQCREQESKGFTFAKVLPVESARHFEQAKQAREVVDARHAELCELENLLRHHAPKLFGLIPAEINFWNSPLLPERLPDNLRRADRV